MSTHPVWCEGADDNGAHYGDQPDLHRSDFEGPTRYDTDDAQVIVRAEQTADGTKRIRVALDDGTKQAETTLSFDEANALIEALVNATECLDDDGTYDDDEALDEDSDEGDALMDEHSDSDVDGA